MSLLASPSPISGQPTAGVSAAGGTIRFDDLFHPVGTVVIGRQPDCSIHLPHPTVSLYHAILERTPDGLLVQDLESATGTYLNGRRIRQPRAVAEGDRIGVGPFLFTRRADTLVLLDSSQSLRLEARGLGREIKLSGGGTRKLLDDVNLVVRPGEFVSLLGPSGSGKSTLMDCLNGRRRANHGTVLANGLDFYKEFDSFRQSLGYVPQKDIVHTQIPVRRALYYTARLRLPIDTARGELEARIEHVIRQMELSAHQHTLIGNLSGGQIKRVSLGAELIARPSLLFIDEATSGLDAGTEARMMRLFRDLADEGKSIICITHAIENVDQCHLVIVLAGGRMMYYGPPAEAPEFFGVDRLSQIYDRLSTRGIDEWHQTFLASRYYKEFVEDRLAERDASPTNQSLAADQSESGILPALLNSEPVLAPSQVRDQLKHSKIDQSIKTTLGGIQARYRKARRVIRPIRLGMHQFAVLIQRYLELIVRDPRSLRLLLLQAPIVSIFLLVGFVHKPYQDEMPVARELESGERQLLTQINAWNLVLSKDEGLTEEQKQSLQTLRFTISRKGVETQLNGKEVHDQLQFLHQGELSVDDLARLDAMQIRLEDVTPRATVSGKDLLGTLKKVGRSQLADLLLSSKKPVILVKKIEDPRFTYVLLNILSICVFWFGCNNAAKEIVKEEAIYGRERAVNLRIAPYLASKFLVLGAISALQTFMLTSVIYGVLWWLKTQYQHDYPPETYMLPFGPQCLALILLSIVGVAVGLLLSACVSSPDRANALLPYVLIPQIILGGAIIPIKGEPISALASILSPVCWGFRAVHRGSNLLPDYHPLHQSADFTVRGACIALAVQLIAMLIATAWFLKLKDVGRRANAVQPSAVKSA